MFTRRWLTSLFGTAGKTTSVQKRVSQEGVSSPPQLPFPKIRCLRILALAPQTEWMVILQMLGVEKWIVDLDCWDFIGKYREIHGNPLSMEVFFGWDFSENCNSLDELWWCTWQCTFFNGISLWISECCVLDLLSRWCPDQRIQGCRSDRSSLDRSRRKLLDRWIDVRGRMSMVDRLWTVIFSRTWRHGWKKSRWKNGWKPKRLPEETIYIYIESVGMALSEELAQEICPFWIHSFRQNHTFCQVASCRQQSSALAKRMGWPWLTDRLTDHGRPVFDFGANLRIWWKYDENMMNIWFSYCWNGWKSFENPWTSSAMIEGMIPISLFQLRVSFCHRHVMSDDWRVVDLLSLGGLLAWQDPWFSRGISLYDTLWWGVRLHGCQVYSVFIIDDIIRNPHFVVFCQVNCYIMLAWTHLTPTCSVFFFEVTS